MAVWPPNSPIGLRAGDDTQLHVPYTAYTFLVAGYVGDVRFGGPTGPGWVLASGSSRSSSSIRVVLHDCDDSERQGLGVRETLKAIAPQLTEAPVNFMLSDLSALRRIVDQAAKTGHELGIIGFGAEGWCAFCSQQTEDANFTDWLAGEVQYARQKDIRLSAYTLMQGNGWGMDAIPEEAKILNRDGSRGPTACFATDWHASYRQRVLTFAAKVGFYGVETDGQFEGASCSDPTHSHHGVSNSFDAQLKVTQRFNNQLKARGLYQTGADAYVFSGANRWNAADTDEAIFKIDNVVEWSMPVHKSNCRDASPPRLNHDFHAIDATQLDSLVDLHTGRRLDACMHSTRPTTACLPQASIPWTIWWAAAPVTRCKRI